MLKMETSEKLVQLFERQLVMETWDFKNWSKHHQLLTKHYPTMSLSVGGANLIFMLKPFEKKFTWKQGESKLEFYSLYVTVTPLTRERTYLYRVAGAVTPKYIVKPSDGVEKFDFDFQVDYSEASFSRSRTYLLEEKFLFMKQATLTVESGNPVEKTMFSAVDDLQLQITIWKVEKPENTENQQAIPPTGLNGESGKGFFDDFGNILDNALGINK